MKCDLFLGRRRILSRLGFWAVLLLFLVTACQPAPPPLPLKDPTPTAEAALPEPAAATVPAEPTSTSAAAQPDPPATGRPAAAPPLGLRRMPLMGTEVHRLDGEIRQRLEEGGFSLIRKNGLLWPQIEPQPGERRWENAAGLEQDLIAFSEMGLETILIVRDAPGWAQQIPGVPCGPVRADAMQAFAAFAADAVQRYSAPPYNVRYWELGNEPDAAPEDVPPNTPYGCWGDKSDEFYNGRYYGEMLKTVYPAMKAANPQIVISIGGLLLACDPTNPPPGADCRDSRFFEGILASGAGDSFDLVSYHGYFHYWGSLHFDERQGSFAPRGGYVVGKADYLREVMSLYGVDKPLMFTEGTVICPEFSGGTTNPHCSPPGEQFYEHQADYVVWLYVRNWAYDIQGTVWYHLESPGWRHSAMLFPGQTPRPAYRAFQYLVETLGEAGFSQELMADDADIRMYEFIGPERVTWVAWAVQEPRYLILPEGVTRVTDKYGEALDVSGGVLFLESPVYIELDPAQMQ